ncbi:hypothetical protein BK634_01470 [Pseudomonas chlororaphis]|nr:hypothetical protein BK634_01470 [Pseudomonas chlororaphis]
MGFYIGEVTGKEGAAQTVQNIGRFQIICQRRQNDWHALGRDCHGMDVRVATDVISMQTDLPGAGGDAD